MSLVERVAAAMVGGVPWTHPQQRQYWIEKAEAAIEAMREPTCDMMAEGIYHWATHDDAEEDVDGIWSAMIEGALRCE